MAQAVFKMNKCTGSGAATETDCSKHPNFLSADEHDPVPSNHPIPIPQTEPDKAYPYECWLNLECTTAPDNQCENFKIWGADAPPHAKVIVYWTTIDTGATPTNNQSTVSGIHRQDNTNYSFGTALALDVQPGDGVIDAIGEKTDYIVMQPQISVGAPSGDLETMTFFLSYEES